MNLLSKYRTELFGIAAMGTVLTHSQYFIQGLPTIIAYIFGYGGSGVYIFALLSGMGLYYSLSRDSVNRLDVLAFYKKRMARVFIPYLLIVGIWYAIKYLFILKKPLFFIYELSTISFWCEHKGAWYVAMLLPVYLIYPFFFKWIENEQSKREIKTVLALSVNSAIGIVIYWIDRPLFSHICGVWCCVFFFILGSFIGKRIKNNSFNDIPLLIAGIFFILAKKIVPFLRNYEPVSLCAYALTGIVVAVVMSHVFEIENFKFIRAITKFIGAYSLEMYLSNLVWVQVFQFWRAENIFNDHGYIEYVLIIMLGILTSVFMGKISRRLIQVYKFSSGE